MNKSVQPIISTKVILIALIFGAAALIIILTGLTVPIPGSQAVTDPRELFTTIGSAITGPVGAIIIGILAGVATPGNTAFASIFAHILGCLWMGLAYKKLVHEHLKMPFLILGWIGLILVYYDVLLIPGFLTGLVVFYGRTNTYMQLIQGSFPEFILTTIITTAVMAVLPRRYRRPQW